MGLSNKPLRAILVKLQRCGALTTSTGERNAEPRRPHRGMTVSALAESVGRSLSYRYRAAAAGMGDDSDARAKRRKTLPLKVRALRAKHASMRARAQSAEHGEPVIVG
jgi:hypothetical protein